MLKDWKDSRDSWRVVNRQRPEKDGDVWGRGRRESFFGMFVDNEALVMVSAGPRAVVPGLLLFVRGWVDAVSLVKVAL